MPLAVITEQCPRQTRERETIVLMSDELPALRVNTVHFTHRRAIDGYPLHIRFTSIVAEDMNLNTALHGIADNDLVLFLILTGEDNRF